MSEPVRSPPAQAPRPVVSTRAFTVVALTACVLIACVVSIFASSSPDGLEYVAGATGFLETARDSATAGSPLADYDTAGVAHPWLSVAIAGAVGCLVTFGSAWLVGLAARRRRAVSGS